MPIPSTAASNEVYTWAQQHTRVYPPSVMPQPGWAALEGTGPQSTATSVHVALVEQVLPGGQITLINGNWSNAVVRTGPCRPQNPADFVARCTADESSHTLHGYAAPPPRGRDRSPPATAPTKTTVPPPTTATAPPPPSATAPAPPAPRPPSRRQINHTQDRQNRDRRFRDRVRQDLKQRPAFQHLPYQSDGIDIQLAGTTTGGRLLLTVTYRGSLTHAKRDPGRTYQPRYEAGR